MAVHPNILAIPLIQGAIIKTLDALADQSSEEYRYVFAPTYNPDPKGILPRGDQTRGEQ